ncbi:hypothetical protein [Kitasatospora sp. NPDC094015]|uniref:hypothetical protein n=1 Tax=Kitasatospora sp. NPDC094015 TaxID=3155205 RepID=UPI0033252B97
MEETSETAEGAVREERTGADRSRAGRPAAPVGSWLRRTAGLAREVARGAVDTVLDATGRSPNLPLEPRRMTPATALFLATLLVAAVLGFLAALVIGALVKGLVWLLVVGLVLSTAALVYGGATLARRSSE